MADILYLALGAGAFALGMVPHCGGWNRPVRPFRLADAEQISSFLSEIQKNPLPDVN